MDSDILGNCKSTEELVVGTVPGSEEDIYWEHFQSGEDDPPAPTRQFGRCIGYLSWAVLQPRKLPLSNPTLVQKPQKLGVHLGFRSGGWGYGEKRERFLHFYLLLIYWASPKVSATCWMLRTLLNKTGQGLVLMMLINMDQKPLKWAWAETWIRTKSPYFPKDWTVKCANVLWPNQGFFPFESLFFGISSNLLDHRNSRSPSLLTKSPEECAAIPEKSISFHHSRSITFFLMQAPHGFISPIHADFVIEGTAMCGRQVWTKGWAATLQMHTSHYLSSQLAAAKIETQPQSDRPTKGTAGTGTET